MAFFLCAISNCKLFRGDSGKIDLEFTPGGLKQKPSNVVHCTTLFHMPWKALKIVRAPPTCTPLHEPSYLSINAAPEWMLGMEKRGPCNHTVTTASYSQAKAKVGERGGGSMESFSLMAEPHLC